MQHWLQCFITTTSAVDHALLTLEISKTCKRMYMMMI
jgi:hypothetical protein